MVLIVCLLIGGGVWSYYAVVDKRAEFRERVANGEFEIRPEESPAALTATTSEGQSDWRTIYPITVPIVIGAVPVQASVADTLSTRIKGLSDTPYLPENVVKLFAFGVPGSHSIWMKDMNYALDIIWADEGGTIVHIEESVSPETFPESFASPVPAWFVVEANAGFVARNGIVQGDSIVLPTAQ